jgi:hypothetical protein
MHIVMLKSTSLIFSLPKHFRGIHTPESAINLLLSFQPTVPKRDPDLGIADRCRNRITPSIPVLHGLEFGLTNARRS